MNSVAPVQVKLQDTYSRKRPRNQPKPKPKSKSATRPRRKPKPFSSEADWYTIRDIIDEKVEDGRIQYLIDWEGTDNNGLPYDPTWEPAEHVTEVAINAWRDKKKDAATKVAHAPGPNTVSSQGESTQDTSTQETEPIQAPNWRHRKRKYEQTGSDDTLEELSGRTAHEEEVVVKRPRTENFRAQSDGPPRVRAREQPGSSLGDGSIGLGRQSQAQPIVNPQVAQIVVELPPAGAFDTSDFRAISLSQPTQQSTRTPLPEIRRARSVAARDDQVIPDSQETESQAIGDPSTSRESNNLQLTLSSALPSHQQDPGLIGTGPLTNLNISTNSVPNLIVNHTPNSPSTTSTDPSQGPVGNTNPVFQSQPAFDWDIAVATSPAKTSQNSIIPDSRQQVTTSSVSEQPTSQHTHITDRASTPRNSQAAQIVQLFDSHPNETISQSQSESAIPEENNTVDESLADQRNEQRDTQESLQALNEINGNTRSFSVPFEQGTLEPSTVPHQSVTSALVEPSGQSRPVTPRTMDDAPATATPGSLRDKLRQLREEHFGTPAVAGATSPATTPGPVEAAPHLVHSSTPQMEAQINTETAPVLDSPVPLLAPTLPFPAADEVPQAQAELPFEAAHPHIDANSSHEHGTDAVPPHAFNAPQMEQPATLNPSTLSLSIENEVDGSPSVPTDDGITSLLHPRSSNSDEEEEHSDYPRSLLPHVPTGPSEYLITLPFQNSIRPQYNNIIRENETLIHEYNACFRVYPHQTPRTALVEKLDIMFSRLFDICDYPPFLDSLSSMSPEQISKHAVGTNAKFAFFAEFLEQLQAVNSDKRVLVLARPGKLMDLLGHVIRTRGSRYVRSGQEVVSAADAGNALSVTLCSTSDEESSIPKDSDVVIAFDHTFRQGLVVSPDNETAPIVLALVTTASIQHLNMRITENLQILERKNVLMLALVKAMQLVEDGEPSPPPSPNVIAEKFAERIQSPEDDDDDFYWEPRSLPTDIFSDLYASGSQAYSIQFTPIVENDQHPGSRKRSYIEDDNEPSLPKRPKMAQPQVVAALSLISDSIRSLLGDDVIPGPEKGTAVVSIDKLEALSAKFAELKSKLEEGKARENQFRQLSDRAQREVNGYVSSINKTQAVYMDALRDRGIFEAECKAAKEEATALNRSLESSRAEVTTLKATRAELEKKLTEANNALLNSSNTDLVKMAEMEKELNATKTEVQRLEKRIVVMQSDTDYSRNMYNQASQRATELSSENRAYESQIAELKRRADDNILQANKVQSRQEARALALQVRDSRNQLRDRELELNRAREELRALRNGRRETRQSSVPHSPRLSSLGVMSPRNGNRVPSAMGGPSSSRGTSPAPPTGVFDGPAGPGTTTIPNSSLFNQGPGASRFSHLRDQRF